MTETIIVEKNDKNKSKKVRRAFSMPRNPFRWSRKFKANKDECSKVASTAATATAESSNGKFSENFNHVAVKTTTATTSITPNPTNIGINSSTKTTTPTTMNGETSKLQTQFNQKHNRSENITLTANRVLRRSSFRKFLSRIAQHVTSVNFGAKHTSASNNQDRVPPLGGYQWPADQTPGVTGLKNHGNTCFMNAVLQCLSHTDILAEYFVLDQYKADLKRRNKLNSRKFGTKGELTEQLANVLKALWTCKNESDHSTSFKAVVDRYGSQFHSSTQHDAQEFLFWLLDKVHEDLNTATKRRYKTIKNNYGRPDEVIAAETLANYVRCNNSFVQAVFQAQFRSSLTCPRCHKQSNTFDPFHCISVQLPQLSQQTIFVTVLYITQHPRQVKLGLTVPPGSPIVALRRQLNADTGIPVNRMVLVDITDGGFSRVFCDSQPISTLEGVTSLYCIEMPEVKSEVTSNLTLLIANVKKEPENNKTSRFGTPFVIKVNHDCTYVELQKKILKEMSAILKPEVFAYKTPLREMFRIRLQDPSADPDTYLEEVEHPLLTEMIDMALSVLSSDAGPPHVKLLLEWTKPENFFVDMSDPIVEHESVSLLKDSSATQSCLTLEQCLEHYTKAETLSAEDAWRCPNCQQYLPVVKTLGLWSLPDILVIHFKRFRQQHDKGPDAAKLTTMVKFPLNAFDMSPHLARGSTSSDSLDNEDGSRHSGSPWKKFRDHSRYNKDRSMKDNRYDLYAVCYHQGDTLETGHYTAACKNPYDHQWYKFDDHRVAHVPPDEVQEQIVNNEAYILFYQRRKIDASECSGTSSTSGDHWVSRIAPQSISNGNGSSCSNSGVVHTDGINKSIEKLEEQKAILEKNSREDLIINENKLLDKTLKDTVLIEKTDENEIIDVEALEFADDDCVQKEEQIIFSRTSSPVKDLEILHTAVDAIENKNESEIKTSTITKPIPIENNKSLATCSSLEYSPKPLWPTKLQCDVNDLHFQGAFGSTLRNRNDNNTTMQPADLRHSFSTSSTYKIKDCDALSMLRNAGSSCSKDTLLYIDQQSHSLIDDDDSFLGGRSLWISPVTPHKLITVSPKN